jgi:penicillin amidase
MDLGYTVALAVLLLLALALAMVLFVAWFILQRTQAKTNGQLWLPGLAAPVEVVRDRWGVPHVYAASEVDALFAQGFVHAQDRLFQMEYTRRLARGALSERFGVAALTADRWSRIVGFWRCVQQDAAQLGAAERAALASYAAGVNAFIAANRYRMPAEFSLLGYKPDPWTVEDTLGALKLMGWALGQNWEGELLRVQLAQKLGVARALELDPTYPAGHPTIQPGSGAPDPAALAQLAERLLQSYQSVAQWFGQSAGAGSNNWVVSGERSVTRRPLLANDPHLSVGIPVFWYQVHLTAQDGSLQVAGASLPGVPGVVIGHNDRIAWGITAGRADNQDLFVEQRHPDQLTHFRRGGTWAPAQVLEEPIAVRGQAEPHVERVILTANGPLLDGLLSTEEVRVLPALALRWSGHAPSLAARGLLRLQKAHGWDSFRAALADVGEPSLNMVYADVDGNIGYQYVARIPRRRAGYGLTPAPGWDDSHAWDGWVPFDDLPCAFNPSQGYLVSANNKPTTASPEQSPFLGADWLPGYRALRIERMLQGKPRFSVRDFGAMQMDVYSVEAELLTPFMVMVDSDQALERRIVRELDAWNLRVEVDSFAAAAYEVMRLQLLDLVFSDKLDSLASFYKGKTHSDIFASSAFGGKAGLALARLLEEEQSWWFHDTATGQPRTRDELMRIALRRTAATLYELIGKDPRKWAWGKVHQVEFAHLLGRGRLLRAIFSRGQFPVSGDEHTVWMTAYDLKLPFGLVTVSATYRQVLDVGDWDKSTAILPTGQSGQPLSEHYADMIDMWREGEQHVMPWSRAAVEAEAAATLWLRPEGMEGRGANSQRSEGRRVKRAKR